LTCSIIREEKELTYWVLGDLREVLSQS
jgi:hypothetical protein